jgi:hypothetical protein
MFREAGGKQIIARLLRVCDFISLYEDKDKKIFCQNGTLN